MVTYTAVLPSCEGNRLVVDSPFWSVGLPLVKIECWSVVHALSGSLVMAATVYASTFVRKASAETALEIPALDAAP